MASESRPVVRFPRDEPLESAIAELGLDELAPVTRITPVQRDADRGGAARWHRVSTWLLVYGVALALIAFWPQPVDSGFGRLLRRVTELIPLLTYERMEFGANILLFVPLGICLSMLLRTHRYLIVPLGFLVSLTIESVQAILLVDRTPSVLDIVANVAGVCIGLVGVAALEALRDVADRR